jgi:hypothetical protein
MSALGSKPGPGTITLRVRFPPQTGPPVHGTQKAQLGCYRNQSRPLPLENIEIEVDETRDLDQTTPSPERTGEADENERA